MQICKIGPDKLRGALDLVWETFMKYEAPDYGEMGIATFRHFVTYSNMVEKVNQGEMTFWGCYIGRLLVGVLALRSGQHISLLFVRDKFMKPWDLRHWGRNEGKMESNLHPCGGVYE